MTEDRRSFLAGDDSILAATRADHRSRGLIRPVEPPATRPGKGDGFRFAQPILRTTLPQLEDIHVGDTNWARAQAAGDHRCAVGASGSIWRNGARSSAMRMSRWN